MKAIQHKGVISSFTAKVDGSLGYRIGTPEMTPQEKAIFFEMQGIQIDVTITPIGDKVEVYKMDKEMERLTPSQRLRRTLYVYYNQQGKPGDNFDFFYKKEVEKFIDTIKEKLE